MIQESIIKLSEMQDLTYNEAADCINEIMNGAASQAQTAAFLMGLAVKGETIDEIAACAESMRAHATRLEHINEAMEIVGTGGDRSNTFNISSTSAIVIAAAGVPVAKHGNRAASSKCGAADVLEALGVNIMIEPMKMAEIFDKIGIAFMHAQVYHKSMKYVAPVRKELGCRTVFNILGPLTNPAFNTRQLLGVYSEKLVEPMARVLVKLGVKDGLAVFGRDVMDEISLSDATLVCEFHNDDFKTYEIMPEMYGFERCRKSDLAGGDAGENAALTMAVLNGEKGARRNVVMLNAGAGLYAAGAAESIGAGIKKAADIIDSGAAREKLARFAELTRAAGRLN